MKCDQIIYTRCSPVFKFKTKAYKFEEGLGIYNLSEGLLVSLKNEDEERIQYFLESCYDDSDSEQAWMYFNMSDRDIMLTSIRRKYDPSKKRKNGSAHRPGNFISQAVIGKFDAYPCDMADNAIFSCAKLDENECYRMDYPEYDKGRLPMLDFQKASFDPASRKSPESVFSAILRFVCSPPFGNKTLLVESSQMDFMNAVSEVMHLLPERLAHDIRFSTSSVKLADQIKMFGSLSSKPIFDIVRISSPLADSLKTEKFILCGKNQRLAGPDPSEDFFVAQASKGTPLFMEFRKWMISKFNDRSLSEIRLSDLPGCFEFYKHVIGKIPAENYSSLMKVCSLRDRFFKNSSSESARISDFLFDSFDKFVSDDDRNGCCVLNELAKEKDFVKKLSASCATNAKAFDKAYNHVIGASASDSDVDDLIRWRESLNGRKKDSVIISLMLRRFNVKLGKAIDSASLRAVLDEISEWFSAADAMLVSDMGLLFDSGSVLRMKEKSDKSLDSSFAKVSAIFRNCPGFRSVMQSYLEGIVSRKGWFARLSAMCASSEGALVRDMISEIVENLLVVKASSSSSADPVRSGKSETSSSDKPKRSFFSGLFGGKRG